MALVYLLLMWSSVVTAQTPITLERDQTRIVCRDEAVDDVISSNPSVAAVRQGVDGEVYVTGKGVGAATVYLSGSGKPAYTYAVYVHAQTGVAIKDLIAVYPALTYVPLTKGVCIRGAVTNRKAYTKTLTMVRDAYKPLVFIDQTTDKSPCQVRFAEETGFNVRLASSLMGTMGVLRLGDRLLTNTQPTGSNGSLLDTLSFHNRTSGTQGMLDFLEQEGMAKILAQPDLTTLSGEKGHFLAGGKIPTIIGGSGQQGAQVSYQDFGVRLMFCPHILPDGRIRLHLKPEVSEVAGHLTVTLKNDGTSIPGLTSRSAETTVVLKDKESLVIAGLFNRYQQNNYRRHKWIHHIPVLGPLLRSKAFQSRESEVVFMITPHIVRTSDQPQAASRQLNDKHMRHVLSGLYPKALYGLSRVSFWYPE
jgi:pilus assembly protein CpaC